MPISESAAMLTDVSPIRGEQVSNNFSPRRARVVAVPVVDRAFLLAVFFFLLVLGELRPLMVDFRGRGDIL